MTSKTDLFLVEPIIEQMVAWIAETEGIAPMDALENFYASETYKMLMDDELQIWDLSDKGIRDLWNTEQKEGNPRKSIYL